LQNWRDKTEKEIFQWILRGAKIDDLKNTEKYHDYYFPPVPAHEEIQEKKEEFTDDDLKNLKFASEFLGRSKPNNNRTPPGK